MIANTDCLDIAEIFAYRHRKADAAAIAVADVLGRRRPLAGAEAGFLEAWAWMRAQLDGSAEVYRDPRYYDWSRTAFQLLGQCLGTVAANDSARRYLRAIGASDPATGLAIHLDQYASFLLGGAWEIDADVRLTSPLTVSLPWALPGSPWSLGGRGTCHVQGIEGRRQLRVGNGKGERSIPLSGGTYQVSEALTLECAPQCEFAEGTITLQPPALNLPDLPELAAMSTCGLDYQWQERDSFRKAIDALRRTVPEMAAELVTHMRQIILKPESPGAIYNTTCSRLTGLAAVTSYRSAWVMAEDLLHEFCHNWLFSLEDQGSLFAPGPLDPVRDERFYSPWRTDARPLYGLFHAYVVFTRVGCFWREVIRHESCPAQVLDYAHGRVARLVRQLEQVHTQLTQYARFTDLGQLVFDDTAARLAQISQEAANLGISGEGPSLVPHVDGSFHIQHGSEGVPVSIRESLEKHLTRYDHFNRCRAPGPAETAALQAG